MTFHLHPQLEADTRRVMRLDLNELLLMNESRYLWCILVPRRPNLRDLHDVPAADKAQMLREIDQVSAVVQQVGDAYKMNVAALGNVVEQLHVHVIARRRGDDAWPGPVWGVGSVVPYAEAEANDLIAELRSRLDGHTGD